MNLNAVDTTWKSYIRGPRWIGLASKFRDRVWADERLNLLALEVEKSLLCETVRFEIEGTLRALSALHVDLVDWIERNNRH